MRLNVNTDEVVALTRKLEQTSKTTMPRAIRSTLNALAFHTKGEMPNAYKKNGFTVRNKSFPSYISRYQKTRSRSVNTMKSEAGFANVTKGVSAKTMAKHETGGNFNNKYVTSRFARISGSKNRNKQTKNRFKRIGDIPKKSDKNYIKAGDKRKFLRVGKKIAGTNKLAAYETSKGVMIYRVKSKSGKNKKRPLTISVLYWERQGSTTVRGRHTAKEAGLKVSRRTNQIYAGYAKRYIK